MPHTLQPGPLVHESHGHLWCYGYVQRFDNRTTDEIEKRIVGWQQMLEQHGRTLTSEPRIIDRGTYVLVEVRFQPYRTATQVRERGTRGGEQAAQRRTSWRERWAATVPNLTQQPQPV